MVWDLLMELNRERYVINGDDAAVADGRGVAEGPEEIWQLEAWCGNQWGVVNAKKTCKE